MSSKTDILLDDNFDLRIENGDFVVGDSLNQEIACILKATPGDYRQHPALGVSIDDYLLDASDNDELMRAIRLHLKSDGKTLTSLSITDGKINIAAENE